MNVPIFTKTSSSGGSGPGLDADELGTSVTSATVVPAHLVIQLVLENFKKHAPKMMAKDEQRTFGFRYPNSNTATKFLIIP